MVEIKGPLKKLLKEFGDRKAVSDQNKMRCKLKKNGHGVGNDIVYSSHNYIFHGRRPQAKGRFKMSYSSSIIYITYP